MISDNENGVIKDVTQHYKALQAQVKTLEEKIELILKKLNWETYVAFVLKIKLFFWNIK